MMPKLIDQANKSLSYVSALISDLLNASKINEGQLQLNKTNFNLAELISNCCYHIRAGNEYDLKIEGDLDLNVHADPNSIEQVITNLANNAIKYAPLSKTNVIRIEKLADRIKVSVIDKGQGIAADKVGHLFKRYYRVDSGGNQYSGLGLGLYISAEIIKKHRGEIGVATEPGEGSTFWFTLPLDS